MGTVSDIDSQLVTYTRDQERDRFTRSYKVRQPLSDVGPGTQPYLDASIHADTVAVLYNDASTIADATNISDARGARADEQGASLGRPREQATGAFGFVRISAASGGTTILENDEIKELNSGLRFRCNATAVYLNGQQVPISGIDVGTSTNLPAGTVLQWTAPRPGCGPTATVVAQSDGRGLSGGHPTESDEEYTAALIDLRANPPASGNDAEYQQVIETVPGLSVEKAFTYPAVRGPGTSSFCFTMRTDVAGASRLPNGAQIATAEAALVATEPADDGIFAATLSASAVQIAWKITWADSAPTWVDSTTWPPLATSDPVHVSNAVAIAPLSFRVTSSAVVATPVAGQTIGLFDPTTSKFKRKRILTVTVVSATHTWDLTCDPLNTASDVDFVPVNAQRVSPWSDSLQTLVAPSQQHFATFGPGEQVASFADPGMRQRRQPPAPAWPSVLTNRILNGLFGVPSIGDAELALPTVPHATPVGTAGVLSYLLTLADIAAFPQ